MEQSQERSHTLRNLTLALFALLLSSVCALPIAVAGTSPLTLSWSNGLPANSLVGNKATLKLDITNNLPFAIAPTYAPSATGATLTVNTAQTTCTASLAAKATCAWVGTYVATAAGADTAGVNVLFTGRNYPAPQQTTTAFEGEVQAWGSNYSGQLGNGTTANSNTPVSVLSRLGGPALTGVTQLVQGSQFSCALIKGGEVKCWGDNTYGQLGNNTDNNSNTPVSVRNSTDTANLTGVTALTAGGYHTCALLTDGSLKCWGYNAYGQLGNGTTANSNTPVTVTGLGGTVLALVTKNMGNSTGAIIASTTATTTGVR